jgi:hypothetical protein
MGYRRKHKTVTVQFDGNHELAGLEVTTRGMSLGAYLELVGMGDVDRSGIGEALRVFADSLVSWNLEDENGNPVPATVEAVYAEDHSMMLKVGTAWLDALSGVHKADPLEESSPGGEPSPAVSIPMEPLSESPALSPAPS